jgi:hypothetical protein
MTPVAWRVRASWQQAWLKWASISAASGPTAVTQSSALDGPIVPKSEFADPILASRCSGGVAAEVADQGQLVLDPEGIVPAGFCLVGSILDAASDLGFGVVADGQGRLTWVVVLVVDKEGDSIDVAGLGGRDGCEGIFSGGRCRLATRIESLRCTPTSPRMVRQRSDVARIVSMSPGRAGRIPALSTVVPRCSGPQCPP